MLKQTSAFAMLFLFACSGAVDEGDEVVGATSQAIMKPVPTVIRPNDDPPPRPAPTSAPWVPPGPRADAKPFVIVSIGDSFASGEGDPDIDKPNFFVGPTWSYVLDADSTRCHRSTISQHSIAAQEFQRLHTEYRVVFKSFACSGASIAGAGLLGQYGGVQPEVGKAPMQPQIRQINDWLAATGTTKIDALLVSVGVNDVGFSDIVAKCAVFPGPNCTTDQALMSSTRARVASLGVSYGLLNEALHGRGPLKLHVFPSKSFLTTYPDPTTGSRMETCAGPSFHQLGLLPEALSNLTTVETDAIVREVLTPLNTAIRAQSSNFTIVDLDQGAFRGHGVCANEGQRYFNTNDDAVKRQGGDWARSNWMPFDVPISTGIMHPNRTGHSVAGHHLALALDRAF